MIRFASVLALGLSSTILLNAQTDVNVHRCVTEANPDVAIDYCSRAIESASLSTPMLAFSFHGRGLAYYKKHDYNRAIQNYDRAIQLMPQFAQAFYNRGLAYYYNSDYDRAIQDFDEAVQLKPDSTMAFNARGTLYSLKGDNDSAVQNYDEAIRLKPDYASLYYNRGNAYAAQKEYDRAIQDYNEAVRLKPDFELAIHNRGVAYMYKKDFDPAIQDLNESVRLDPKDALAFCNRGSVYAAKGELDHAIQEYSEAIRLNPGDVEALWRRADTYASKGEYERAIQDLNEAIRLHPTFESLVSRGVIRFEQGDFASSVPDFTRSTQLEPTNMHGMMWLYIARSRAGLDPEEALINAQKLDLTSWPGPLISLYRGEMLPNAVMEAAADPDSKKQRGQMCDAHFYVAEYDLLRGLADDSNRELLASVDTCPATTLEYDAAKADLKRLAR